MTTPRPASFLAEVDDEFARFFRSLGYTVIWDFQKATGAHWYEILDGDDVVCQVDFDTPLQEFLADLPHFVEGRSGIGPTDYDCRCKDNEKLQRLLARVRGDEPCHANV